MNQQLLPCMLTKSLNTSGDIVSDLTWSKKKQIDLISSQMSVINQAHLTIAQKDNVSSDQGSNLKSRLMQSGVDEISFLEIELESKIGEGEFGFVYAGRYIKKYDRTVIPLNFWLFFNFLQWTGDSLKKKCPEWVFRVITNIKMKT